MKNNVVSSISLFIYILAFSSIASYAEEDCSEPKIIPKLSAEDHQKLHDICVAKTELDYASLYTAQIPEFMRKNTKRELHLYLAKCQDEQHENYIEVANQLAALPNSGDPIPESQSSSPWLVSVSMGKQFLPDYENGATGGLDKSQSFGEVIIDHREVRNNRERHWGAILTFEGQPVHVNSDKNINNIKFNDVADTMTAGLYFAQMLDFWKRQRLNLSLPCDLIAVGLVNHVLNAQTV